MEEGEKGLSAGRVQSVAVKLIIDRENEIREFKPEEYWTVTAVLLSGEEPFEAKFYGYGKRKRSWVPKKMWINCLKQSRESASLSKR